MNKQQAAEAKYPFSPEDNAEDKKKIKVLREVFCRGWEAHEAQQFPLNEVRLDLKELRRLSILRAKESFKTYDNQPITYWTTALAGELGELCNMVKKIQRVALGGVDGGHSYTAKDITSEMLKEEIGGIALYLDLIAGILNISLEDAIIETFNAKSREYNWPWLLPINPSGAAPQAVKLPDSFYNCLPAGYEFVNEEPLIQSNYDGEGNEIPGLYCCMLTMKAIDTATESAPPSSDPFIEKHLARIKELQSHYANMQNSRPPEPVPAPPAAGPVWVKTKDRNPIEEKYYHVKRHNSTVDAIHFWYSDRKEWSSETDEWLDESGIVVPTQQLFTREQVQEMVRQARLSVYKDNCPAEDEPKIDVEYFSKEADEWFNTNYPLTK